MQESTPQALTPCFPSVPQAAGPSLKPTECQILGNPHPHALCSQCPSLRSTVAGTSPCLHRLSPLCQCPSCPACAHQLHRRGPGPWSVPTHAHCPSVLCLLSQPGARLSPKEAFMLCAWLRGVTGCQRAALQDRTLHPVQDTGTLELA